MENLKNKTRVVCTIGPASSDPEMIRKLIKNGMNVARLNFSHGTHDSHREIIKTVRAIAKEENVYVGILQDLCGPKIRLGTLPDEGVRLIAGDKIMLSSNISVYEEGVLPISYPGLDKEVKRGESILLSDGMMELKVEDISGDKVVCEIINGGQIFSRKGVNLPLTKLSVSAFSAKDRSDFEMGLNEKVDFVALSFVRSADDLKEIREMIENSGHKPGLIAKIEKPQAVDNLDEILAKVDGIMVARGDLGVELPLEQVPILQKRMIRKARKEGKFAITATQMLMSMVMNPRPTRGEASDVANAVLDGTDAIMLSDESANGKYPVEACGMLGRIAAASEPYRAAVLDEYELAEDAQTISKAVGRAACWMAKDVNAKAIIAFTSSGFTAWAVAQFRPECPIIALTANETTCSKLSLCWGTVPVLIENYTETDKMFEKASNHALTSGYCSKGDKIVITAGVPLGVTGSTNLLRVIEL